MLQKALLLMDVVILVSLSLDKTGLNGSLLKSDAADKQQTEHDNRTGDEKDR